MPWHTLRSGQPEPTAYRPATSAHISSRFSSCDFLSISSRDGRQLPRPGSSDGALDGSTSAAHLLHDAASAGRPPTPSTPTPSPWLHRSRLSTTGRLPDLPHPAGARSACRSPAPPTGCHSLQCRRRRSAPRGQRLPQPAVLAAGPPLASNRLPNQRFHE
ncbi:hypothetical protein PVAP13_4NG150549 [Panicum virgatum]|uniref:Uncharacterized protein n=1 Tax=Panicum virgatum TaxID=38727 RepID=A0A8T0T9C5_PANVG|nr:hypothetical protein PVAP13_4NG150549 [Panicum virgatum]